MRPPSGNQVEGLPLALFNLIAVVVDVLPAAGIYNFCGFEVCNEFMCTRFILSATVMFDDEV